MPDLNPDNPFVLDPHYFDSYANKTVYTQTSLYMVRLVNNSFVFGVNIFLSSLLFYLIFNEMPSTFKPYRKMLVLSTAMDTYAGIVNFATQVRLRISNGYFLYTFNGFASFLNYSALCPCIFILNINQYVGVATFPVQFFYRYLLISRNRTPSTFQIFGLFLLSISPSFVYGFNAMNMTCLGNLNPDKINYAAYWYEESPVPVLVVGSMTQTAYAFHQIYGTVLISVYYVITLSLALATMKDLNTKFASTNVTEPAKKMQRQIGRALFAQLTIPLLTLVLPRFVATGFSYFNISTRYAGEYIKLSVIWFPALSLLSTILFIAPFRKFCLRFIPCSSEYDCENTRTHSLSSWVRNAGQSTIPAA